MLARTDDDKIDRLAHVEDIDKTVDSYPPYVPGSDAEKRLLRKIDLRLIPIIWLLTCLSFVDRSNIANAKTGGMEKALHLTSNQYSVIVIVFFIGYVFFEVPSNLLLSHCRPSIYLAVLAFIWGGVSACLALCNNFQTLTGVRFVLGMVEAGFVPGVLYTFSSWYKKYEISTRYAIYYTATALSGAFSGLIAGLIIEHMDGAHGIPGWRWLFIIEGVATMGVALVTWLILPDWPRTTTWLTEEERMLAIQRVTSDGLAEAGTSDVSEWVGFKLAVCDWRVWCFVLLLMIGNTAQTSSYFIPTLVANLGWKGYDAQYHTIPVYIVAMVYALVFLIAGDRLQKKGLLVSVAAGIGTVCYIICASVQNKMVQYVFLCFGFGSTYAVCPLVLTWAPNVITWPARKRAVAVAMVNGLGNLCQFYGAFLWPAKDAPKYTKGWAACTAFMGMACLFAFVVNYLVTKYPVPPPDGGDDMTDAQLEHAARGTVVAKHAGDVER